MFCYMLETPYWKTKIVNFGQSKKRRTVQPLHINKEVLIVEKQYKYLGILLDSSLKFEAHYKEIVKTFSVKLYLYRRIINC